VIGETSSASVANATNTVEKGLVRYDPEWSACRVALEFFSVGPSVWMIDGLGG
jgi:hypothetical protein